MKRPLLLLLGLILLLSASARAAEPPVFDDDYENLATYLRAYGEWAEANPQTAREESRARIFAPVERTLEAIPYAVDPSSTQAERDGLPSFSSLFDLGIDSIESGEDEGSFVVKFNETRLPVGSIGVSATVRMASPSDELLSEVDETSKKAVEGAIDSRLEDLDDLTFSAQWGLEKSDGPWRIGRRVDLYSDELEPLIAAHVELLLDERIRTVSDKPLDECRTTTVQSLGGDTWEAFNYQELLGVLGEERLERCLRYAREEEVWVAAFDQVLDPLHILGFLIDNQPQLVVTGQWHDRDRLAGRDGWEISVEYSHGLCNLNKILEGEGCGDEKAGLSLRELKDLQGKGSDLATRAQKGHKLTFEARYAERNEVRIDETFGTGDDAIALDLLLPEATEKQPSFSTPDS